MTRTPWSSARRVAATVAVGAVGSLVLLDGPQPGMTMSAVTGADAALAPVASVGAVARAHPRWRPWPGHRDRRLHTHRVRPGDTATGLAVRFHAWTDELRALNHLGPGSRLYVGERIHIPIVVSAWRRAHRHHAQRHHAHHQAHHHKTKRHHHKARHHHHKASHHHHKASHHHHKASHHRHHHKTSRHHGHPWRFADASRAKVRRVVERTAARHGVSPSLLLAIAWQESGWQQRRVSSAGAIGVMQVMPSTGRWISSYAGHPLNLYGLHDNVTAGALVIRVLGDLTSGPRVIGAYYQGLGSILAHGMYDSTRHYVRNVRHLRHALRHGWDPS